MRRRQYRPATTALLALALWLGQGCGDSTTVASNEENIINGTPDTSEEHQAVVFLLVISAHGAWSCSGTLITPTVVMTAGHCVVASNGSAIKPQDATVYFGNVVGGAMMERAVAGVYPHPQYQPIVPVPNDIALLALAETAPDSIVPIPPLPPELGLTQDDIGTQVEYAGFGLDENGNSGRKLHVFGTVDVICGNQGGCPLSMVPSSFCAKMDDGGTCSGDSGGPAFVVRDAVEYVAGITSYGDWRCTSYGCSTKVDGHASFIQDVIGTDKPIGARCISPAQCQSGFCVDGFCCDSACSEPCQACDVPKQQGYCLPAPDGHDCSDGDPCNGSETCQGLACTSQGDIPDCNSLDPCLTGSCQAGVGCVFQPVADGTACDNLNACDGSDTCREGRCLPSGPALDCDDGNPCTDDACDPQGGCTHNQMADGTSCSDGLACNGEETCQAGACQAGTAPSCDDDNACTQDSCDDVLGCQHQQMPEGSSCGDGRTCQKGLCLPAPSSGCSTGGRPAGSWLAAWLLGLLCRRRRGRC